MSKKTFYYSTIYFKNFYYKIDNNEYISNEILNTELEDIFKEMETEYHLDIFSGMPTGNIISTSHLLISFYMRYESFKDFGQIKIDYQLLDSEYFPRVIKELEQNHHKKNLNLLKKDSWDFMINLYAGNEISKIFIQVLSEKIVRKYDTVAILDHVMIDENGKEQQKVEIVDSQSIAKVTNQNIFDILNTNPKVSFENYQSFKDKNKIYHSIWSFHPIINDQTKNEIFLYWYYDYRLKSILDNMKYKKKISKVGMKMKCSEYLGFLLFILGIVIFLVIIFEISSKNMIIMLFILFLLGTIYEIYLSLSINKVKELFHDICCDIFFDDLILPKKNIFNYNDTRIEKLKYEFIKELSYILNKKDSSKEISYD